MKTKVCEMLDIEVPIFAFSHCRDVVAEVSRAGGMGVLGISGFNPEQLEQELKWIDDRVGDKPYGVDLMMPNSYQDVSETKQNRERILPQETVDFVAAKLDEAGIPRLPDSEREGLLRARAENTNVGTKEAVALFEVVLRHSRVRLMVSALGTPSREMVDRAHEHGLKVGSLVGKVEHALAQQAAGVDIIIAQGTEAGGHTGKISSLVLWPQIVDAVAPLPVLAAGGIGRGRQMAAALALGAEGVWCGSIWLGTVESELLPEMKQRLFAAAAEDAPQTRALSGKPMRALRSKFTDIWEQPGAPKPLQMPLQFLLNHEPVLRINRAHAADWMSCPVGQIVGDMKEETSVRQVVQTMLTEFVDATERVCNLLNDE